MAKKNKRIAAALEKVKAEKKKKRRLKARQKAIMGKSGVKIDNDKIIENAKKRIQESQRKKMEKMVPKNIRNKKAS